MKKIENIYSTPTNLRSWLASINPPICSKITETTQTSNWKPLYFIAMTARSGSTMLCSIIEKLEHLGVPDEYLNPRGPFQMYHSKYGGENFKEYLTNIYEQMPPKSQMLGIKTAFIDFYPIVSNFEKEINEFSKFIYLTRLNIYAQSVSLWSAKKTQLWHSFDETRSKISLDQYNYEEILMCLTQILDERVKWEAYFSLYGITPYRISYEDICANQELVLHSLVDFLGVQINSEKFDAIKPSTTAISSDFQKEIVYKFQEDFIARGELNNFFDN